MFPHALEDSQEEVEILESRCIQHSLSSHEEPERPFAVNDLFLHVPCVHEQVPILP